jgi:hypothetical protein
MKNILEKYAVKEEVLKEKEEKEISKSQIEDQALKLVGQIKKFCQDAKQVLDPKTLNLLMAAKKRMLNYGHLNEDFSIAKSDLSNMSDSDVGDVMDKVGDDGDVRILDEDDTDLFKYYVQAGFTVFVGDDNEETAEEKARELLSLIDQNHDGANPKVIYVDPTARGKSKQYEGKTYTKEELLKELKMRKKGYIVTETLNKKEFLNKFRK